MVRLIWVEASERSPRWGRPDISLSSSSWKTALKPRSGCSPISCSNLNCWRAGISGFQDFIGLGFSSRWELLWDTSSEDLDRCEMEFFLEEFSGLNV